MADWPGRRNMIWFSILGTAPFSWFLAYSCLFWSVLLCFLIGFIFFSGLSVIVVYSQELLPGKVGSVSGLFFGLAYRLGGLGSAVLGTLADYISITFIMKICACLPLVGLLATFLPANVVLKPKSTGIEASR